MNFGVVRAVLTLLCAGSFAIIADATDVRAQTAVRFSLDSKIDGAAAPFFLALDRGYFKREGLDVTIDPAATGLEPITRLAGETYDIALGDFNALVRWRDQNPTTGIKAVFILQNLAGYAVVSRRSRGVAKPKDLEEAKIVVSQADAAAAQWPIFVKLTGIDIEKATILNTGIPVREPMLAAGEADAVVGLNYGVPLNLRDKGVPADDIVVMRMSDYGLTLYGSAIMARPRFLAEKPEAVKAFVAAVSAALKDTIKDPAKAIDALVQRNGSINREAELQRLNVMLKENVLTAQALANGLGAIDAARFDKTLEQIGLAYSFKNKPALGDIFEEGFVPESARTGN
ncbi:MAG: ABC transporter substrate-binding protein [Variibacter sp.]